MEVKSIAVIGAGAMGREMAYAAAFGGYRTILEDVSQERLTEGAAWIKQTFEEGVSGGKLDAATRNSAIRLLHTAPNVEDAIRGADLVVETVPDELEMKLELFTIFDKFAKPGAFLASTTRSLSIGEISDVTVCRDRCIGMRFIHSVPKMRRIELVRTPFTSEDAVAACSEVARRMGREVVVVNESPSKEPAMERGT
jgi:3-hydroxybutyryl-CoA dehydrogenase